MRKLLLLSIMSILVAALAAPVTADKGHSKALPFKATFSGQLLGFNMDPVFVSERCVNPSEDKIAFAVASFEGSGIATHMGNTDAHAEHCSYATAMGPDGTYGQGEFTMVAANGDILTATYTDGVSFPSPPAVGFMDVITFDDRGTGRFNFASGGGVEVGSVNLPPEGDGSFILHMEGVISYSRR